ncbi:endonuclease/exonuclease/phosphatase family protein [Pseudooctadecabacter sp.]|uniref:endonuclease/exonuclease/phosphatase family protein n=1 Tax=Pseudooctadecabacter sp. TaxID=1966338 RepID=UPI0025F6587F|nr:endonuclease/exonuclease/phosphatase family protein [Pseudooctadecabacter sp.]
MTLSEIIVLACVALVMVMTLVPFVKYPHGLIRGPEFVRLQLIVAALVLAAVSPFVLSGTPLIVVDIALVVIAAINAVFVLKFTPLWPKQSATVAPDLRNLTDRQLMVLTANVKMSNRDYDATLDLARDEQADILALIEPDQPWIDAMGPLRQMYDHHIELPKDTGYGLALYSNLALSDTQVRDLVTKGVPSITTTVTLRSGDRIALYIIHPEPPTAQDHTTGRDSEIAAAGLEGAQGDLPCIIAGDLNDVAWSHTTRRFQRITGLLDPRVGRGFFNTFNAFYPFFRWPLDHLFHDPRFRFVAMRRLRKIGSDHFPISFTLALAESKQGDVPPPSENEIEDVTDMIEEEKAVVRTPIGTDWETSD